MRNKKFVLDANVFLEIIFGQKLQDIAKKILEKAILNEIEIIVPGLALDEIAEVLCGNVNDEKIIAAHFNYIDKLILNGIIKVVIPSTKVRLEAIKMARIGNKKSGYPEYSNSLYHTLAILNNATFITNDKKHFAKVKNLGAIKLLCDLSEFL